MLKPKFTSNQVKADLEKRLDGMVNAVQILLLRVGEEFVTNARNNGSYKDHTGNLRSSIGYVLLKNGIQVGADFKSFPPSEADLEGTGIGPDQAKAVIDEIITKYPEGLTLICIAGMEYAAAVESKGYDVISSSVLIAVDDLKQGIARIKSKVGIN